MCDRPKTVEDLFHFYYEVIKPVYAHVESLNQPPVEMFFEINAAFDHLSRHWQYGEDETEVVKKAADHLKRCAFDAFKIILRETRDQYDELCKVDVKVIDNGQFQREMVALWSDIRERAGTAREQEGDSRDDHNWDAPFELWREVYVRCVEFDREFYQNKNVQWARALRWKQSWKELLLSGVVGAALGWVLSRLF